MKTVLITISVCILFMGCQSVSSITSATDVDTGPNPSSAVFDGVPELTEKMSCDIIYNAHNKFSMILTSGMADPKFASKDDGDKIINGQLYYAFGETLNTIEKLHFYLGDTFTDYSIERFEDYFEIIEYQGELFCCVYGAGSTYIWEDIQISSININDDKAIVTVSMPIFDDSDLNIFGQSIELDFDLEYIEGRGWLINIDNLEDLL